LGEDFDVAVGFAHIAAKTVHADAAKDGEGTLMGLAATLSI